MRPARCAALLLVAILVAPGPPAAADPRPPGGGPDPVEPGPEELEPYDPMNADLRLDEIWRGDLDGIAQRGRLRVLVAYNMTNFFLDGPQPRGLAYEAVEEFAKVLNRRLGLKTRLVDPVYIPAGRHRILTDLAAGRGDLAVAALTATEARSREVAFSDPTVRDVRELVVTGPGAPPLASLDDLSGVRVWVRPSSSFHESLLALNERLASRGIAPAEIVLADEHLETEDLLELVAAGVEPATVADSPLASFWADVHPGLRVHEDLVLRDDVHIGWAVRKDAPALLDAVNGFVAGHQQGTLFGNVLLKRYVRSNKWVRNHEAQRARERVRALIPFFQRYADRYALDWLLMAAQGFQESGLDQGRRSPVGAVGVMQVLPSTAADMGLPDVEDLETNIHAGIKYMRWLIDHHLADPGIPPLDRHLLAFAAYNAGPNRIARLRKETASLGLDPDRWFENVEVVVARRVGREPVQYVANIYKYYIAYETARATGTLRERLRREQVEGAAASR